MRPHPATMIGRLPDNRRNGQSSVTRKPAPFRVFKRHGTWVLAKSNWGEGISGFDSVADAVDHAYRNWPWAP